MLLLKAENAIENRISPNYEQSYLCSQWDIPLISPSVCDTADDADVCISPALWHCLELHQSAWHGQSTW